MGSGSSLSSRGSTPEREVKKVNQRNSVVYTNWNGHVITSNGLAPILISRDCYEEFQCIVGKQKPVLGSISEGNSEHALIKGRYFMVSDLFLDIDEIHTLPRYGVVNFRSVVPNFPVYGMGQPSGEGLKHVISILQKTHKSGIVFMNVRAEPVLFLKNDGKFISYSPRRKGKLIRNISSHRKARDLEAAIAKELIEIATTDEDNQFYFYDDVMDLTVKPQSYHVEFLEDFQTTEQIYALHVLAKPKMKFVRLPCCSSSTPSDESVDMFLTLMKELPGFLAKENINLTAFAVNCQTGHGRTTVVMVMTCLLLSHRNGFPQVDNYKEIPAGKNSRNFERGEFSTVLKIMEHLPHALQIKQEVDVIINLCGEIVNIRQEIYKATMMMNDLQQDYEINGVSTRYQLFTRALIYLERYCFLIIFNAYLHDQFSSMFLYSFQSWLLRRPDLVRLLTQLDNTEKHASPALLMKEVRFLMTDDSIDSDVMSSKVDVGVSNFRGVRGIPIYGMAQHNTQGLQKVLDYLTDKKRSHSIVHLFNLRSELVVECDGETYAIKEPCDLATNISIPEIESQEIERKENHLKNEILLKSHLRVYQDAYEPPIAMEFKSVLTLKDIYNNQLSTTEKLRYHRLPMSFHEVSPKEENFDCIVDILRDLEEFYTDEDGPALVFNCHSGRTWTTVGMVIAGLICWHKRGFPLGTKLGEQERVSLRNAEYTKGEFAVVMQLVRRLPRGLQVKREVDLMLDKCCETMTPMHYHLREIIFSTCNKVKTCDISQKEEILLLAFGYLERYIYFILFNAYLHMERSMGWKKSFSYWMKETGHEVGAYTTLDSLNFHDVDGLQDSDVYSCRERWKRTRCQQVLPRGSLH